VNLRIEFVASKEQMEQALAIRRRVFIEEQQVPEDLEIDEHDRPDAWGKTADHALAFLDDVPVATGRLLLDEDTAHNAHIGRVAVLAERRKEGIGRALMGALQDRARILGYPGITLAAQLHALGFYGRLGYAARGDVFLDAGIEHRWMDLAFEPKG
jgi:predicted GNAT family N-acyltransferase